MMISSSSESIPSTKESQLPTKVIDEERNYSNEDLEHEEQSENKEKRANVPLNIRLTKKMNLLVVQHKFNQAKAIFNAMKSQNPTTIPMRAYAVIINCNAKQGDFRSMFEVFSEMKRLQIPPDLYTYSIMIDAFANNGDLRSMLQIYEMMRQDGVIPNEKTFSSILRAFAKSDDVDSVFLYFDQMRMLNIQPNDIIYDGVIDGLIRNGRIEAITLLIANMQQKDGLPITDRILHSMEIAFEKLKDPKIFQLMNELRVQQTEFFSKNPAYKPPTKKWHVIKQELSTATVEYTKRMNAYLKEKQYLEVEHLYNEMKSKRIPIDLLVFSAVLRAFSKLKNSKKVQEIYEEMLNCGVYPDLPIFNTLISCFALSGEIDRVLETYLKLLSRGFSPNLQTYRGIMEAFMIVGDTEIVASILEMMYRDGIQCNTICFSVMLNTFLRKAQLIDRSAESINDFGSELLSWFHRIGHYGMNTILVEHYLIAFQALSRIDDHSTIAKLLRHMSRNSIMPNTAFIGQLVDSLKSLGDLFDFENAIDATLSKYSIPQVLERLRTEKPSLSLLDQVISTLEMVVRVETYSIQLWQLINDGRLSDSLLLLRNLKTQGIFLKESQLYESLLECFKKEEKWDSMMLFFESLPDFRISPNQKMYHTLIEGYIAARKIHEAVSIVWRMKNTGVKPTVEIYNLLIFRTGMNGQFQTMYDLFRQMVENDKLHPNLNTWVSILQSCKERQSTEPLEKMKSLKDGVAFFNLLKQARKIVGI